MAMAAVAPAVGSCGCWQPQQQPSAATATAVGSHGLATPPPQLQQLPMFERKKKNQFLTTNFFLPSRYTTSLKKFVNVFFIYNPWSVAASKTITAGTGSAIIATPSVI